MAEGDGVKAKSHHDRRLTQNRTDTSSRSRVKGFSLEYLKERMKRCPECGAKAHFRGDSYFCEEADEICGFVKHKNSITDGDILKAGMKP